MIIVVECLILMILFTGMVFAMAKDPIKTLYNYPPKIVEKVKELEQYKERIPTQQNKFFTKSLVAICIVILISLIFKYINGYTTFKEAFLNSLLIWTIINIYDVVILDILWFCRSPKFVFKGTEDIMHEYKNYLFHIKEGVIGEFIGLVICIIIGIIVGFAF